MHNSGRNIYAFRLAYRVHLLDAKFGSAYDKIDVWSSPYCLQEKWDGGLTR